MSFVYRLKKTANTSDQKGFSLQDGWAQTLDIKELTSLCFIS